MDCVELTKNILPQTLCSSAVWLSYWASSVYLQAYTSDVPQITLPWHTLKENPGMWMRKEAFQ